MAILPSLPNVYVAVHNDQGELTEYPDTEPDAVENLKSPSSVVVSNYIEAPSDGGPFWLNFIVEPPYQHNPHSILFVFEPLDADFTITRACDPGDLMDDDDWWDRDLKGYAETDRQVPVMRCFQFSTLKILPGDGENDNLLETERKNMESIGKLQIRVLLGKAIPRKKAKMSNAIAPTTNIATEKLVARKGLSMGMIYNETPIDASNIGDVPSYKYVGGWDNPLAIFQFKYRSKADLQKLLLVEKTPEPEQLPTEDPLPTPPITPMPSCAPSATFTSKAFGDLTFTEVRDLARKQYISFDKLGGDEIEKLARKKHAEQAIYANDELASVLFGNLTFAEVRSLAKKQYKSFDELNGDEIEELARQGHSEEMASPKTAISGAVLERKSQEKRSVSIKVEDADYDVVFVSATKKRKSNGNSNHGQKNVKTEKV